MRQADYVWYMEYTTIQKFGVSNILYINIPTTTGTIKPLRPTTY